MIPIIKKTKGYEVKYGKWTVKGYLFSRDKSVDIVNDFNLAFRYWLYHCGVSPKIAFKNLKH